MLISARLVFSVNHIYMTVHQNKHSLSHTTEDSSKVNGHDKTTKLDKQLGPAPSIKIDFIVNPCYWQSGSKWGKKKKKTITGTDCQKSLINTSTLGTKTVHKNKYYLKPMLLTIRQSDNIFSEWVQIVSSQTMTCLRSG